MRSLVLQMQLSMLLVLALVQGAGAFSEIQESPPRAVLISELIAHPEKFAGWSVIVIGWFDGYRLWPSKSTYELADFTSFISVNDPTEAGGLITACEGKTIQVVGTFNLKPDGRYLDPVVSVFSKDDGACFWKQK